MKFQSISLPDKRPRDALQLKKKIPLYNGLTAYYLFGVFALTSPFIPAVYLTLNGTISKIGWIPLILIFLLAEILAFFYLNHANKNYLRRLRAFSNGLPVKAIVKSHSKSFIFWKIRNIYSIELSYVFEHKIHMTKLNSAYNELFKSFPINSEITGLYDPESDSVCFPPEIGLLIEERHETFNPRRK